MRARPDEIFDLLSPRGRGPGVELVTGYLTAWNGTTFENTVEVDGIPLSDLPVIHVADPADLATNTVVALLRSRGRHYILGRVTTP
jgi:hypothetical protein